MEKIMIIVNNDDDDIMEELAGFPDNVYLATPYLCSKVGGNRAGLSVSLDPKYLWQLVKDNEGTVMLIAKKKKEVYEWLSEDTNLSGT